MKTKEDELLEGKDAPLTDMIYGVDKKPEHRDTDILPESDGRTRGVTDPLQLFINMYQPGEFVTKENFRKHLLQILNAWHLKCYDDEVRQGTRQVGISMSQNEPHVMWGEKLNNSEFYVAANKNFDKWLFNPLAVVDGKKTSTVGKMNQKLLHQELDAFINKFKKDE